MRIFMRCLVWSIEFFMDRDDRPLNCVISLLRKPNADSARLIVASAKLMTAYRSATSGRFETRLRGRHSPGNYVDRTDHAQRQYAVSGQTISFGRQCVLNTIDWIISYAGVQAVAPGLGADYGLRPIPQYAGIS